MDGGSSLNLIYEDTLETMQFDKSNIEPSHTTFKLIIPGKEAWCIGSITLEVIFGTPNNYRIEELTFNIVPFRSGYHALLGRDMCAKFYDVPHFAYKKLKMSGLNVVIILGNIERSHKTHHLGDPSLASSSSSSSSLGWWWWWLLKPATAMLLEVDRRWPFLYLWMAFHSLCGLSLIYVLPGQQGKWSGL